MRILLIDDSQEIIDFLKVGLKPEGFIVDTAEDGDNGSFLARTNDYDLILLDYLLPKKDGLEVCNEIRRDGKAIPILVLSARDETEIKISFLNAGADDYLIKPFAFSELLARIKALLRRPREMEKDILRIDNLSIDINSYSVKRGSAKIYLTRREFSLLEYLMKNRGKVLSRGMIMEHVWDMETDIFSNTIETHILNLRRKIDIPGKKKLIHTIQGRGYKLDTKE